jgi:hypothetical protein
MRHRTQLGEDQRQRGNERDAKLEAMVKSWQGRYLAIESAMLSLSPQLRNCFTQIGVASGSDAAPKASCCP